MHRHQLFPEKFLKRTFFPLVSLTSSSAGASNELKSLLHPVHNYPAANRHHDSPLFPPSPRKILGHSPSTTSLPPLGSPRNPRALPPRRALALQNPGSWTPSAPTPRRVLVHQNPGPRTPSAIPLRRRAREQTKIPFHTFPSPTSCLPAEKNSAPHSASHAPQKKKKKTHATRCAAFALRLLWKVPKVGLISLFF